MAAAAALSGPAAIRLEAAPRAVRVVSQTVGSDELLLALARPAQIAALSPLARDPRYCALSAEARAYPTLAVDGDAESVLRFRPTLVLCADYTRPELIAQLRRSGVRLIVFDHYATLDDVYANLRRLGRALGEEPRAEGVIATCRARVAALAERLKGVRPVRVIAPSVFGFLAGYGTTFEDLCEHAGAENLAATLGHLRGNAPQPSEEMLSWPIDRVVVGGTDLREALAPFRRLPPYEYLPAVRAGRAALLPACYLACVSQERIRGYELLARALHPAAFK
ncbi:MAG: ABC transporter substrate-binding protein [Opitutaceae bacterium]